MRFDPGVVDLGGTLAPPYDVISTEQRERLYARDLRNIVRIDYGSDEPGDRPGVLDRYTRAAGHLGAWLELGILRRDPRPAVYVADHEFTAADGSRRTRRGLYLRTPALPWDEAAVLPHERTLRGPKEDRLALMRATRMQTSAVFSLWDSAPGIDEAMAAATEREPDAEGTTEGEVGDEHHRLWVVDDPARLGAVLEALGPSRLYIADGHHRFETAATYAAERRAAEPGADAGADFGMTLLHLCAATDPSIEVLPTHRLVRPAPGVPDRVADLLDRLDGTFRADPAGSLAEAVDAARRHRDGEHALAVAGSDGAFLLRAPRRAGASPRAALDVSVLQELILERACGLDADAVAGGALGYTRGVEEAEESVAAGTAALAICLNGCTTAEIIAVSDARETMPQKSTYFYPKVPTGLVLSPL
ncbi:MAG: hypothetical protein QOE72_4823 [Chloroflexota bacterium]|nr:hypothetical protein [Chloroflexota bacterium]